MRLRSRLTRISTIFVFAVALLLPLGGSAHAGEGTSSYRCIEGDCKYGKAAFQWRTGSVWRKSLWYGWHGSRGLQSGCPDPRYESVSGVYAWRPYRLSLRETDAYGGDGLTTYNDPDGTAQSYNCSLADSSGAFRDFSVEYARQADLKLNLRFIWYDTVSTSFTASTIWYLGLDGPY